MHHPEYSYFGDPKSYNYRNENDVAVGPKGMDYYPHLLPANTQIACYYGKPPKIHFAIDFVRLRADMD